MKSSGLNLQDSFLNQARKDGVPVTIYLVSGIQLKGHVKGFDAFTVILESTGRPWQMVYKHAIASIVPLEPVNGIFDYYDNVSKTLEKVIEKDETAE